MPISINGTGTISGVSDFSSSNIELTDPEITGGIYLGGTGSANKLDDYEEGIFTPVYKGGGTYKRQLGQYTKVGDLVVCNIRLHLDNKSGVTDVKVTGLPFTIRNTERLPVSTILFLRLASVPSGLILAQASPGTNEFVVYQDNITTGVHSIVPVSDLANNTELRTVFIYYTDS